MRQIKFRGRRLEDGKWVYGSLMSWTDGEMDIFTEDDSGKRCNVSPVNPETVGQFTGLYDKDGREIYEGDIVSWLFFHGSSEVGKVEYKREEAQFRIVNRFTTMDNREIATTIQNKRNLIVRGNIHDNPELLKGGEK